MSGDIKLPAPLVATLSLAWTGEPLRGSKIKGFIKSPEIEKYFANCYHCAFDFIFNESFPLHPKHSKSIFDGSKSIFLGTAVFEPNPGLGPCQYDAMYFLFDDEDGISTHLLQIHIRARHARSSVDKIFLEHFCAYANQFISPNENHVEAGSVDDPALNLWSMALRNRRTGRFRGKSERRKYALAHSYFATVSVFGLEKGRFEDRADFKQPFYSLLYMQPNGTDEEKETSTTSKGKGWSSTNFFEAWLQPGGAVLASTGYPEANYNQTSSFSASFFDHLFSGDHRNLENRVALLQDRIFIQNVPAVNPDRNAYDFLPEYPPLRYVAPVAMLYGLLYEEILRDTYERLLALSEPPMRNPFNRFAQFIVDGREIRALTRRMSRIDTLEHLRLPVSRPLGDLIIESKLQHQVAKAIEQLRANKLTLVAQALAILGTILAVVGAIAAIMSLID